MKTTLFGAVVIAAALLLLWRLGLKPRQPPQEEKPLPALASDAAFIDDLRNSVTKGLRGIAVIAPASGLKKGSAERFAGIMGELSLAYPEETLVPDAVPYLANRDDVRLRLLAEALTDPEKEVLWPVRGGYGSGRLLRQLDEMPVFDKPKLFIGYSDMTFLHLLLRTKGWRTVHGAVLWELNEEEKDEDNFRLLARLLAGRSEELRYENIRPFNAAAKAAAGTLRGEITGGNLTCVAALAGTPWKLQPQGNIVFLEDVKEAGYKLDRLFTQLRDSGGLDGATAVLLGSFTKGDDHSEHALRRFADDCELPVFRSDQFGHGKQNYPLVFNAPSALEMGEEGETFVLRIEVKPIP